MEIQTIQELVHECYWAEDLNCVTTTLKIMAERYGIELTGQLIDAAVGMHGAGGYRSQCGLVEGGLLFLGVLGRARMWPDEETILCCRQYAEAFEQQFGSLLCRDLRPEGFGEHLPPHLCEKLSWQAVAFGQEFIDQID